MSEANVQVAKRLIDDALGAGDVAVLDAIVDPSYRSHIAEASGDRMSHWTGPAILRVEIEAYRSGIPDLQVAVTDVFEEGDSVAVFFGVTGTNSAKLLIEPIAGGIDEQVEPTGILIRASGAARLVVTGGKVTEAQFLWSPRGPLDQIRLAAEAG